MNKSERIKEKIAEISAIISEVEEKETKGVLLGDLKPGERFNTELGKFIVLGHENGTTKVIQDDFFEEDIKFDNNSCDYKKSALKKMFDENITPAYEKVFGEALVEHEVKLVSVDMQDCGKFKCKVRPITFEEAREFNSFLIKKALPDWWWTCTPWSSVERGWRYSVAVVSPSGVITFSLYVDDCGVRPLCILKSNIFVSKED